MGIPQRTVYDVISRWEQGIPMARKPGSVRKAVKMPPRKKKALLKVASHNIGSSTRNLAETFTISQSYVRKVLASGG